MCRVSAASRGGDNGGAGGNGDWGLVLPGLPVPKARSGCPPDRAVGQIARWDIFPDRPSPRCWTSAAARPSRPDFELENSPATPAASIRNSPYPTETERTRSGRRLVATLAGRSLWAQG